MKGEREKERKEKDEEGKRTRDGIKEKKGKRRGEE